jgi:hypothetical protein
LGLLIIDPEPVFAARHHGVQCIDVGGYVNAAVLFGADGRIAIDERLVLIVKATSFAHAKVVDMLDHVPMDDASNAIPQAKLQFFRRHKRDTSQRGPPR